MATEALEQTLLQVCCILEILGIIGSHVVRKLTLLLSS